MKKFVFIALLLTSLFATSCSSYYKSMKQPNIRYELNSADFTISEQVVGEATVVRVFGIDWARLFCFKAGFVDATIIGSIVPSAGDYAIYDLLEKNPGYDFVMYPQYTSTTKGFPGIYTETKVKVVARLGRMKRQ